MDSRYYEIFNLIGEGSFGKVYKARCPQTKALVAYKVISKNGRKPSEVLALREECEIQKHLQHPNIIRMLHSFETEEEIVVVTEFAVKDLCQVLKQEGVFQEDKARRILYDLVAALSYLHSNRVCHRDLKPQNVLLDAYGTAKLCDFGFAKSLGSDLKLLTSIKGTPLYMAPELMNESPYDYNADLWSLGCIAYELVTGHTPYTTTSILQLIKMVKLNPIKWPDYLSQTCLSFLKGLLQKNPTQRLSWPYLLYHPFIYPTPFQYFPAGKDYYNVNHLPLAHVEPPQFMYNFIPVRHPIPVLHNQNARLYHKLTTETPSDIWKQNTTRNRTPSLSTISQQSTLDEETDPKNEEHLTDPTFLAQKEEWLEFLKKNIWDVMYENDTDVLSQSPSLMLIMNAFNSCHNCPTIVTTVSKLLSLPFVVEFVSEDQLTSIKQTYFSCGIIKDLLKVVKQTVVDISKKNSAELNQETALQHLLLLICNLTFTDQIFLKQFFSSCVSLKFFKILKSLLSLRTKTEPLSIVKYSISIILRMYIMVPQSRTLIVSSLQSCLSEFHALLREENDITVHVRLCIFITVLGFTQPNFLNKSTNVDNLIEDLTNLKINHSLPFLHQAADGTIEVLKVIESKK